ncbi:Nif3-like dinuclear metal center hexameric protein [Actinospica sp. MGRD01-02]|uniref:GTP cyclohydrolase 1 type 2 homolog n=1 Tax=Actinospica acidithermotolerans TaxID=2828514 RepID=A0A941EL52_9ACTN|nr:Nif3-like dinuclear metal center hexameric protein [Actinospica acidithermotolerans]MBR7829579.1 Nif3-like dinuclear metal center hexameric protein [Actinospica acidithermotolerans]
MPELAEVLAVLDAAYPPAHAQPWDAVGLVCGDPRAQVERVLFAVDPVDAVLDEALDWGAQLLVTHHPLLLKAVNGVPATNFKGRNVHRLIRGGCALLTAHTNADVARPGVSDAFAEALGLAVGDPILPLPGDPAGRLGLGRYGELPEAEPLAAFTARVARALPATASGVRAAGDPDRPIRRVAVCGGAGDDRELLAAVRAAGVDAYVTADLRHHPASEAMEDARFGGGPALVDVAHFASEWPWLSVAAGLLAGGTVETRVSTLVTDPWTAHTC